MKGVILAAGKGTRLYPVTHHIAKPLLPLANRMTIEYAFDQLKQLNIKEVCIIVGDLEQEMKQILGNGSKYGLKLSYAKQPEQKGLAHALTFAKDFLKNDNFVLYLGDAIYDQNFNKSAEQFLKSGCANLNIVKWVEDPSRFGVAIVEDNKIVRLVEKPKNPESNLAMAGLYFFTPKIWEVIPTLKPSARGEYEITDAIQALIDKGYDVQASLYQGEWFDTGTLDSFIDASRFLTSNRAMISKTARVNAEAGDHVVIGEQASVKCKKIEDSVVLPGAQIEVDGEIRHSILGGTIISNKSIIGQIEYGDSSMINPRDLNRKALNVS
jgi:glucose-1-phosphate thymidylyltransferase